MQMDFKSSLTCITPASGFFPHFWLKDSSADEGFQLCQTLASGMKTRIGQLVISRAKKLTKQRACTTEASHRPQEENISSIEIEYHVSINWAALRDVNDCLDARNQARLRPNEKCLALRHSRP
jgi:hypothetical protein